MSHLEFFLETVWTILVQGSFQSPGDLLNIFQENQWKNLSPEISSLVEVVLTKAEEYSQEESLIISETCFHQFRESVFPIDTDYTQSLSLLEAQKKLELFGSTLYRHGQQFAGSFFLFTQEEDHFHCLHSCPFSNNSCRCSFRKANFIIIKQRPPLRRRRYFMRDWSKLLYYCLLRTAIQRAYLFFNGEGFGFSSPSDSVQPYGIKFQGLVERENRLLAGGTKPDDRNPGRYFKRLLEWLLLLAFPNCPEDARQSLAVQFFTNAIRDEETQRSTRVTDTTDLKAALDHAMKFRVCEVGVPKHQKRQGCHVGGRRRGAFPLLRREDAFTRDATKERETTREEKPVETPELLAGHARSRGIYKEADRRTDYHEIREN